MENIIWLFFLLLGPAIAMSTPFVVSGPTTQKVTHGGIQLDSDVKVELPVTSVSTTSAICKYDVGSVSIGAHNIKATFINNDPLWGKTESVYSLPLSFERPNNAIPQAPTGLDISK